MTIDPTIQFIYVDLFCGAGGTSTGVEDAKALTYSDRKKFNRIIEEQIAYRRANDIKCANKIGLDENCCLKPKCNYFNQPIIRKKYPKKIKGQPNLFE